MSHVLYTNLNSKSLSGSLDFTQGPLWYHSMAVGATLTNKDNLVWLVLNPWFDYKGKLRISNFFGFLHCFLMMKQLLANVPFIISLHQTEKLKWIPCMLSLVPGVSFYFSFISLWWYIVWSANYLGNKNAFILNISFSRTLEKWRQEMVPLSTPWRANCPQEMLAKKNTSIQNVFCYKLEEMLTVKKHTLYLGHYCLPRTQWMAWECCVSCESWQVL